MLCMNPLDLLKIKFQVSTSNPPGTLGKHIWYTLRDIKRQQGWGGLYRGLGPNIAGNASSWGLYFLLCASISTSPGLFHMLKRHIAITCSRNEQPRGETLHDLSPPGHIYSVPPKQVRNLFLDGFFTRCLANSGTSRCSNGNYHEPVLARPSKNVYYECQFAFCVSRFMGCVFVKSVFGNA